MLLVLTTSEDATADYLCARLLDARVPLVRLDTDHFVEQSSIEYRDDHLSLLVGSARFHAEAFNNVWYRRPRGIVVSAVGTEAQRLHTSREWGASLDGFLAEIPEARWMNHPASNARAGSKLFQLSLARRLCLRVPDTIVTQSVEDARAFWGSHGANIIAKPLSFGAVENLAGLVESQILTFEVHDEHLRDPELFARCPTLLQQRVEKGVDVRVTLVDREVCALAASPRPGTPVPLDIRENGMSELNYEPIHLPIEIEEKLRRLCELLHLRFAAIDLIRSKSDEWFFLEVNPNGQWAWLDLVGASDIAQSFARTFGAEQ